MTTILVIDNKPEHLKYASEILQQSGFSILETWNAGDAIRIAKEDQPELILMDLELPGLDGQTTTRLLKSNPLTRHIKIVAQSCIEEMHQREKLLELGVSDFLEKPYQSYELIKMIKNLLSKEILFQKNLVQVKDKEINKENNKEINKDNKENNKDSNKDNTFIPPSPMTPSAPATPF